MAEKNLSEAAWKAFTKGKAYKDAAFAKALTALAKAQQEAEEDATSESLERLLAALEDLERQGEALARAHKGDRELVDRLSDISRAASRLRQTTDKLAREHQEQEQDEASDTPDLLTTKMLPVVRQAKKGLAVHVLLAYAGKATAVLLMRKPIPKSRRKLMAEFLGVGGVKYITGQAALPEGQSVVAFVLETSAGAGMAKRIGKAILDQTGERLKLRCRAADSGEEDADDSDEGSGESGGDERAGGDRGVSTEEGQFRERWAKLGPRVLDALRQGLGDVSRLRAVNAFVEEKSAAGNYEAALKAVLQLESLLDAATRKPSEPETPKLDAGAAFNARLAALMPQVKTAVAAGGAVAQGIKLKVSEAGVFARKREFERAGRLLDEAEALLARTGQPGPGGDDEGEEDARKAEVEKLLQRLQPEFDRAGAGGLNPEAAALFKPIGTAWAMAQESIEAGHFERALTILRRLADSGALARVLAVRDVPSPDSGRLVKQRQFMLQRWGRIPGELRAELGPLRGVIETAGADSDPAGLVDAIAAQLDDLLEELQDMLDDAIEAGDTKALEGARQRALFHPLMRHLRDSPGFDGSRVTAAVLDAIGEVEQHMTAA